MGKVKNRAQAKPRSRRVAFSMEAAGAGAVALVGTFNDWDPHRHVMQHNGSGTWKKTVMLSPGVYEYKFWIDGRWVEDPCNVHTRPNPFGTVNSIVAVSGE